MGKNVQVLEKSTFVDEFENVTELKVNQATDKYNQERMEFNSHIKDNLDKILHRDLTKNDEGDLEYQKSETTSVDGFEKREEDVKCEAVVDNQYVATTKASLKTVLTMVVLGITVAVLPVLVVKAGKTLNKMEGVINEKTVQIEELYEELNSAEDSLAYESSDEVIIDKAKDLGMVE